MKLRKILLAAMMFVLCCVPASALEYSFDAPDDYLFGRPTSDDTIYRSPKKVFIDELIDVIQKDDRIIIIDGLDHVENYNPNQLGEFIEFINKLSNARTVVLSRPLKQTVPWEKVVLSDWLLDETRVYLEIVHNISDYRTQSRIFDISRGYPIITYFLAEEYTINHKIDLTTPITGINEYYDALFANNEKPSSAIGVFASGNCFFTWKELKEFFDEPEMFDIICEFIAGHPYLFKIILNRVSLIHDSFNTYLRTKIKSFGQRQKKTVSLIGGVARALILRGKKW